MKEQIEKQAIEEMAKVIEITEQIARDAHCGLPSPTMYAKDLYRHGYRKQEWISVEDRLPDKYGDFICCTRRGTIWQLTYNPKYKLFNVSSDNVENAMDVTHWMPLPDAPKGGAE